MFIPWMVIYLPAILSLLIFCCIKFWSMEGKQLAAILLVGISAYFYAIVVASYIELKLKNRLKKVSATILACLQDLKDWCKMFYNPLVSDQPRSCGFPHSLSIGNS